MTWERFGYIVPFFGVALGLSFWGDFLAVTGFMILALMGWAGHYRMMKVIKVTEDRKARLEAEIAHIESQLTPHQTTIDP